jgi:hypothetical protein
MRGTGRATFAAILLLIAGTLNILDDLNRMGWVLIILAAIQLTGGFSLLAGNAYGRVIGIIGASLGAIGALFSIGGANPWWSLAVFFLCIWVVYGIVILGEDERELRR